MGFLDTTNPFYREKEDNSVWGKCKNCDFYSPKSKQCKKYNMISESWQNCKSCTENKKNMNVF